MHCTICPSLSLLVWIISISDFSLNKIATPELFGMGPQCLIDLPVHLFFHFLLDSSVNEFLEVV